MTYPNNFETKIGFTDIRQLLLERCISTLGKERVQEIQPTTDATVVNRQLREVSEFRRIQEEAEDFPLQYFFDMRQSVSRLRLEGTHLDEGELFDLRRSLETISNIVSFLNRTRGGSESENDEEADYAYPTLHDLTKDVQTFPSLIRDIDQVLDK